MKKFKANSIIFISVIAVTFCCNVYYLVRLYNSIRTDVEREVMTAMIDADIDDLMYRAGRAQGLKSDVTMQEVEEPDSSSTLRTVSASTYRNDNGQLVYIKTDENGMTTEEKMVNLSQNTNFANQVVEEMSRQFHMTMDKYIDYEVAVMDSVLGNQLAFRQISPEFLAVEVVDAQDSIICPNPRLADMEKEDFDSFVININPKEGIYYKAYLTPLTRHILSQMKGVIITTFMLMVAFAAAFRYLFNTVSKLRTIEEMKDDFVNNMTHELKTPISIAYSANDALLNYDTDNDQDKKVAYLTIAIKQLKRLGELVENILAMSMERRKTMVFKPERISLPDLVEEIAEAQRMRCEKDIDIEVEYDDKVAVIADKQHLSNVLNNLIDNSIKYSGDAVLITIKVNDGNIEISDNGDGIPQKSLPFIFDKFYRVPHGNRQDVRGYGVGLYYVKHVIDKMGWNITVNSQEGYGTTFTLKFKDYEGENTDS